jgi:hypothetical protein
MATYLQDGVGIFPQDQGFTPNYNFIMRTLEMRQNQYDQGFAQVKSVYNSILNADLSRADTKERRDLIIANAEKALKDLPMIDLGNAKNVSAAKSVFKPFYEDDLTLVDITETKKHKSGVSAAFALRNSDKEEDRKRFWTVGIEDMNNSLDEFVNASADQAVNMRVRSYVGKPQVSDQVLKMFNDGKLKISIDKLSGMQKITYENGQDAIVPMTNLYLSLAQNDPEAMEGFNVYGRVQRTRFIKDNVANGRYATREEAANAHDQSLVNDYVALQDKGTKQSTEALNLITDRVKQWEKKLADGTLTEQEEYDMAADMNRADELKKQIEQYNINRQNASNLILRNPSQYLGQVYLHKSANDLATALSSVSFSKEISSNPIYKDFVFSKEFEVFKTDEQIRLEKIKSQLNIDEERIKAQLKEIYGDGGDGSSSTSGGGGGASPSRTQLNIPEVRESTAASGKTTSAYNQFIDNKREYISRYTETKANLVLEALDPNEIVDSKGKVLNQNQIRALVTSGDGTLLDQLYAKAITKMNGYKESNPEKYNKLNSLQLQATNFKDVWLAMDRQGEVWLKEIIGNLESTETYPERVETYQRLSTAKEATNVYVTETKRVPGRNDGWIYKHLVNSNSQLMTASNVDEFLKGVTKDKNFEDLVAKRFEKNKKDYAGSPWKEALIPGYVLYNSLKAEPTLEQARTQVTNEMKEKFGEYRDKVLSKWNERGLNFITQYSAMPGGGGVTSRVLTFTGSNKVSGETADVITQDLLTKLPGIGGGAKDVFVVAGPDKPKTDASDGDEELKKLVMNGILSRELMNAIKLGKDSELKGYSITSSMVGGSNPNYHAYTLTFDADFIAKMKGTEDKPGLLGANADKLINGLTIYVNKDKDNTLASQKSTMGEIDILVNTNPQGTLTKEVIPGYGLTITKNSISGSYKIKTYYPQISTQNLQGIEVEREVVVPAGADLTTAYYETVQNLQKIYSASQILKDNYIKSQPKKATMESVNAKRQQLLQNRQ